MRASLLLLILSTTLLIAKAPEQGKTLPPAAPKKINFARDIAPILKSNCISCHGPEKQRGGLRLDSREHALKGSNSGSILKPKDPAHSRLMTVVAGLDPEMRMPPGKRKLLTATELGLVRAWIEQGLPYPKTDYGSVTGPRSDHWAFRAPIRPALPDVKRRAYVRNAIDRFVLARLEQEGIAPSPLADRATQIRRVSLDLLGIPATPEQVDAFINDSRPDAYERVVERLLASPAYGERWARHWLDAARYADSDGFEKDKGRPFAWRWRNWVINAYNRDLPYDQFVIHQLAGDLLPKPTMAQRVATGFHRNTLTNREGGVDKEQFRVEAVVDRVNTTAKAFLGITLACAQCHDHKYDPFSQREHYQFFAFFNSDKEVDIPAPVPGKKYAKGKAPKAQAMALGMHRKTHVLIRGDFLRKGVEVKPGVPAVLSPLGKPHNGKEHNRLDLARWIASPRNPLTARVMVNQTWYRFFGRALVTTMDDFGARAEKPSHPQLLDWLATELIRQKWSIKSLHRLIVTSATYRQSSKISPDLLRRDPLNQLLARQARSRLDAEVLRDTALFVSGLLVRKSGGPSVRPPQPKDISRLTYANSAKWVESKGEDRYRRGLYTWFQRTSPYPMLLTFDAPDSNVCCVKRERSCTPLQALTVLNDQVFMECAKSLADRVIRQVPNADAMAQIRRTFRLVLGREPHGREMQRLTLLHSELLAICKAKPGQALKLLGEKKATSQTASRAALMATARTILNLDELVTRE